MKPASAKSVDSSDAQGACRLCDRVGQLEVSHIIPKFVIRWQNDTSVSPLRASERPNVRVQDGTKLRFLCGDCEDLFEKWETAFAPTVFAPLHRPVDEIPTDVAYGAWGLKFAVSVSWRVLKFWSEHPRFGEVLGDRRKLVDAALQRWAEFLRGDAPHPARFEQHVLPLALVDKPIPNLSPSFNRYVARAVDHTFVHGSEVMFVYSKLGRLVIFGFLPPEGRPPGWHGTKLHVKHGRLRLRDHFVEVPEEVIRFMSERADDAARLLASVSPKQRAKIDDAFAKRLAEDTTGELFDAILRDYDLFGDDALRR